MFAKCRVTCIVLSVLSLVGMGLSLFAFRHMGAAYFCMYTCVAGLMGNWIVTILEYRQAKKEARTNHETAPADRL